MFRIYEEPAAESADYYLDGYGNITDSHDKPVVDPVWALYAHTIARGGPRPTLIEWDSDLPEWSVLRAEAEDGLDPQQRVAGFGLS